MQREVKLKYERLLEVLRNTGGVVVALSGGVDSAVLLAAAKEALGDNVIAAINVSATLPKRDLRDARKLAESLGVRLVEFESGDMHNLDFLKNNRNRCYICKRLLFTTIKRIAMNENLPAVVEGSTVDDLSDYRPGARAAEELGIWRPLLTVGLSKPEVREIAKAKGLDVWDKPQSACLASRIPYGSTITDERLSRIDNAEEFLRSLGFETVRVRDFDGTAVIELDAQSISKAGELAEQISAKLRNLGFLRTCLDLAGYRRGSMNEQKNDDRVVA